MWSHSEEVNIQDESREIKKISGLNSILRDTVEALKHFYWDTVFMALEKNVPTLMSLLKMLITNSSKIVEDLGQICMHFI